MPSQLVQVRFSVLSSLTRPDPALSMAVIGGGEALGEWDVRRALRMQRVVGERVDADHDEYDLWEVTAALELGQLFQYKYCILRDGLVETWEAFAGNRAVHPGVSNAALGGEARLSSVYVGPGPRNPGPRPAATAVNGNTTGMNEDQCAHSQLERQPWFEVDLGRETAPWKVVLWNRVGRCAPRIVPFWLLLLNEPAGSATLEQAQASAVASHRFETVEDLFTWTLRGTERCSVVRVQLEGENFLHFAELQVFERSESDADSHVVSDGVFGEHVASLATLPDPEAFHDSHWLSPAHASELRIMLGTREGMDSVQLINPRPLRVGMTVVDNDGISWCGAWRRKLPMAPLHVEPTGAPVVAPMLAKELSYLSDAKRSRLARLDTINANINTIISQTMREERFEALESRWSDSVLPTMREVALLDGVGDEVLEPWLRQAEWRRYDPGAIIICQGEQRTSLFALMEGSAIVTVRDSAIELQERDVSRLSAPVAFGEMAMVSGGLRTANVRAGPEGAVVAMVTRGSFVEAVGGERYRALVQQAMHRSQRLPVKSVLTHQDAAEDGGEAAPEGEDPAAGDVFEAGDVQVFSVNLTPEQQNKATILLEVFDAATLELIGTTFILPSHFTLSSGLFNCTIIAPPEQQKKMASPVVGEMFVQYLITNPLVAPGNSLETVWRTHWPRSPRILDVGHRGLGSSYHSLPSEGYRPTVVRENTLMSFVLAGRLGADFVEFDVQLTKDRVPVIYHDFLMEAALQEEETSVTETLVVGIHELTRRQLQRCKLAPHQKHPLLRDLIVKHRDALLQMARDMRAAAGEDLPPPPVESPSPRRQKKFQPPLSLPHQLLSALHLIPTLQALFEGVPDHVGFNIEVKYPVKQSQKELLSAHGGQHFEKNGYLDAILAVVFRYAGSRRIFFSCFDPDICVMLRAKQAIYPVLFLTNGGTMPDSAHYSDTRCLSLKSAVDFCTSENLQGIVTDCRALIDDTAAVRQVKNRGLLLFSYGSRNNNADAVTLQKQLGVDGVISDNVPKLTREAGKSVQQFEDE